MTQAQPRLTPGRIARKVLGPRFQAVGEAYRRIFVDLNRVADAMAPALPSGARVLDVGGGDGALAAFLLARRPDLSFTMVDLAPSIGSFLDAQALAKVELRPATPIATITAEGDRYDAVIVADVIHHVPQDMRDGFFADLRACCDAVGAHTLIVKDIEPGGLRAWLAVWSDWYVTGDRQVRLAPAAETVGRLQARLGVGGEAVRLTTPDPPNYCAVIRLGG